MEPPPTAPPPSLSCRDLRVTRLQPRRTALSATVPALLRVGRRASRRATRGTRHLGRHHAAPGHLPRQRAQ